MSDAVVPVEQVQQVARQIALIAALALIQSRGDAANAIARLEGSRGTVNVMAESGGWQMDVVQAAQESIEQAAQIEEADDA